MAPKHFTTVRKDALSRRNTSTAGEETLGPTPRSVDRPGLADSKHHDHGHRVRISAASHSGHPHSAKQNFGGYQDGEYGSRISNNAYKPHLHPRQALGSTSKPGTVSPKSTSAMRAVSLACSGALRKKREVRSPSTQLQCSPKTSNLSSPLPIPRYPMLAGGQT